MERCERFRETSRILRKSGSFASMETNREDWGLSQKGQPSCCGSWIRIGHVSTPLVGLQSRRSAGRASRSVVLNSLSVCQPCTLAEVSQYLGDTAEAVHGTAWRCSAVKEGLTFYQTRSNAIILQGTLPAHCILKVERLKTGDKDLIETRSQLDQRE